MNRRAAYARVRAGGGRLELGDATSRLPESAGVSVRVSGLKILGNPEEHR
jgi:hypothetical protein